MTDSFSRTKMIQLRHLEPHARIHVRACLRKDCVVLHACCGCILCTLPVDLSVLRSSNPKLHAKKKMSLNALRQALKNATTMNSNFAMKNSAMMRTTKTKYAASVPAALCTISIVFSDQQHNHNLHFRRIADSDFDAFVCSDELVCRAALFPIQTRLVVADILFVLRHNLGVVVEVVEVLQHLSREPNALNFVFVQLS